MNAIRVRRRLDSHVINLPELTPMVGKTVEIIVLEESEEPQKPPTAHPRDLKGLDAIAGRDVIDVEAFETLRRISKV